MTGLPHPPRAREHRTRPVKDEVLPQQDVAAYIALIDAEIAALAAAARVDPRLIDTRQRYPEDDVNELIRANAADAHYDEDDL